MVPRGSWFPPLLTVPFHQGKGTIIVPNVRNGITGSLSLAVSEETLVPPNPLSLSLQPITEGGLFATGARSRLGFQPPSVMGESESLWLGVSGKRWYWWGRHW